LTVRVLLVDVGATEPELGGLLVRCGFSVRGATDVDDAAGLLGDHAPSLVVVNVGSAGSVDAERALHLFAGVPVVVVCAGHDADLIVRWLEAGADTVLVAPISRRELGARIKAVLGWHSSSARGAAGWSPLPAAPRYHPA
jgi:DNA-binding response OmpR family regulator